MEARHVSSVRSSFSEPSPLFGIGLGDCCDIQPCAPRLDSQNVSAYCSPCQRGVRSREWRKKWRDGLPIPLLSSTVTIAFLDVGYKATGARAACVLTESWEAASPHEAYVHDIEVVEPYEPGQFYRRELPCLLAVLRRLPSSPQIVVVDGYVWLASPARPGLGARLHQALGGAAPVVGIAKTAFAGVESSGAVVPVYRGTSQNPLFVTAVGLTPDVAGRCVRRMAGKHRIPELVRITDRLSRSGTSMVKVRPDSASSRTSSDKLRVPPGAAHVDC